MKMRDIANIIRNNNDFNLITETKNGQSCYLIDDNIKLKISEILSIPCFDDYNIIKEVFLNNSSIFFSRNQEEVNRAVNVLQDLQRAANLYLKNFNSLYPSINENSISFKFQETNDLNKISTIIGKLDLILNQLFSHNSLNSGFELCNFDHGSKWLDICLKNKKAFLCFSAILQFISSLGKDIQEIRLKEVEIEKIKMEAKLTEEQINIYKEVNKTFIKNKVEKQAAIIQKEYYKVVDNDLYIRIKGSMMILIDLYIDNNSMRPTDLIAYQIPKGDLNPWGYIEEIEKKKIEYKEIKE